MRLHSSVILSIQESKEDLLCSIAQRMAADLRRVQALRMVQSAPEIQPYLILTAVHAISLPE